MFLKNNTYVIFFLLFDGFFILFFIVFFLLQKKSKENKVNLKKSKLIYNNDFEILSHLSHDIRTPLNTIIGLSDLSINHINDSEKLKNDLQCINTASTYLLNLINSILDFSKIKIGKETINLEIADLKSVFTDMIKILQESIDNKKIKLIINNNLPNVKIKIDVLKVQQIFLNILSNAYKYTNCGGRIEIYLNLIKIEETQTIIFKILDNGIGMSQSFIAEIFEPYSRSKKNDIEGCGLGMNIVKDLITILNGKIYVESKLGFGSTFTVKIPVQTAEEIDLNKNISYSKHEFANKRVLLVDDLEVSRLITKGISTNFGLIIDEAVSGKDALKILKAHKDTYYSIILMDLRMPEMDGYETTSKIRKMKGYFKRIPIIALTADVFEKDVNKVFKMGMNDHIAKPIDKKEILKVFCKWL